MVLVCFPVLLHFFVEVDSSFGMAQDYFLELGSTENFEIDVHHAFYSLKKA